MGWGKYDIGNGFSNPLGLINKELRKRNSFDGGQGGLLATDTWFSGNASLFGGIEWYIPKAKGLKFKLENNPFNYFDKFFK